MPDLSKIDWHVKARGIKITSRMLIDGELVDAASGKTFASTTCSLGTSSS